MSKGIILVFLIACSIVMIKFIVQAILKCRAAAILNKILFPLGESQKRKVIATFNAITNSRFSPEEIVDYFIKTKGRQMFFSGDKKFSNSIKSYLNIPTIIDLDYFEQVKFHKIFINYPNNIDVPELSLSYYTETFEQPIVNPKPTLVYRRERVS